MIAKVSQGKSFRGVFDYLLKKEDAEIIAGSTEGKDSRELSHEYQIVRELRPDIERAVWHCSLSLAPGEHLPDGEWDMATKAFLRLMKFPDDSMYTVVRHRDTDHEHVHIVVSRISLDGSLWDDGRDWFRARKAKARLESMFGLQVVEDKRKAGDYTPPKKETEAAIRTGEPNWKYEISQAIKEVTKKPITAPAFIAAMAERGITARPNVAKTGTMSGFSFEVNGFTCKGSQVSASWKKLKEVVDYDAERDYSIIAACAARTEERAADSADAGADAGADIETGGGDERRGADRASGLAGDGADGAAGRAAGDRGDHSGAADGGDGADDASPAGRGDRDQSDESALRPDIGGGEGRGESVRTTRADGDGYGTVATVDMGRDGSGDDHRDGGEPAVAAGAALVSDGDAGDSGGPEMTAQERSIAAKKSMFWRMHHALDAPCYRIMAKPREEWNQGKDKNYGRDEKLLEEGGIIVMDKKGKPERFFTAEDVAALIPVLEAKNKRGFDIYICPDPRDDAAYHYIVLDDLPDDKAEKVAADGYAPCLRQRSSENNQQVILKVKKERASGFEQSAANDLMIELNKKYGGDEKINGVRHNFRMTGFLNRKPERRKEDNTFWMSELLDTRRGESEKAAAELDTIRTRRREQGKTGRWQENGDPAIEAAVKHRFDSIIAAVPLESEHMTRADREFCDRWQKYAGLSERMVKEHEWKKIDRSVIDFRVCVAMLKDGWEEEQVKRALAKGSPAIPDRWNPIDYTGRTIQSAVARVGRDAMRAGLAAAMSTPMDGRGL